MERRKGGGDIRLDGKNCLDGHLELFGLTSDWITTAQNASAWHGMVEARAETVFVETWRLKRVITANIRHACRAAKKSTAKPLQRRLRRRRRRRRGRRKAPTTIGLAEEEMVADQC